MAKFQNPPIQTPFQDAQERITEPWLRWYQEVSAILSSNGAVTGSKGGNAALASLISNLAAKGIIVDGTT